jgi:DNA-binding response OmpR family regulator
MTKSILFIDDEPDITFTIKNILEENDFKVDTFNDPIIGLKSYKINFYDLVILDIKMSKMDGFKLYTKIREKDPKVKICFLTATAMFTEEIKTALLTLDKTIDKDYFIHKPIKIDILIKHLTRIMNKNEE